jgi:hypothetical protein
MEKPQLFISEDLPAEEKLVLACSQKILDLMVFYKEKQEAGTLTLKDLEDLSEQGNAIADEFPVSNEPVEGFPPQTSDMDELEAIANARAAEDLKLLEENGGPVFKIESFAMLKELADLPPQDIGERILEAARNKREAEGATVEPPEPSDQPAEPLSVKPETEFSGDLIKENLEKLRELLLQAKLILFDLQGAWPDVEPFEDKARLNARAFKNYGEEGGTLLLGILSGEEKDEELADKRKLPLSWLHWPPPRGESWRNW